MSLEVRLLYAFDTIHSTLEMIIHTLVFDAFKSKISSMTYIYYHVTTHLYVRLWTGYKIWSMKWRTTAFLPHL
jgi:hypothetical protein